MTDTVDRSTRSRMMAAIKGHDTTPEMVLRKALHARGLRYRLHVRGLPGRPDLVFPRRRAVVFVHGCFWHRHEGCPYATMPRTRPDFWASKFAGNVSRDQKQISLLLASGWRVAVVWECAVRKSERLGTTVAGLEAWLCAGSSSMEFPEIRQPGS
jgi:DNA mismatch endonuclease (patch repair protein)